MCSLSRALFQLLHYICTGGGGGDVDLHRRPLLLPAVQHQAEASRRHSNYYILIVVYSVVRMQNVSCSFEAEAGSFEAAAARRRLLLLLRYILKSSFLKTRSFSM